MRFCCRKCVLGVIVSLVATCDLARQACADGYGTLTGQFVIKGALPDVPPLKKKGDPTIKDPEVCGKANIPDESLVIDPLTKGIANVFIFMPKAPANVYPGLKESKEKLVKFDQKGCRFIPHAMILRTDQTVAVLNGDPILHNTHVNATANTAQNLTIPADDRAGSVRWKFPLKERYVTQVKCDIHSWMTAWWLIIDHPYATVTDETGRFKIENIPAGEQEFIAWQERTGWVFGKPRALRVRKYTVKPNETTDIGVIEIPVAEFESK